MRPRLSGRSTSTCRSKRPARSSAGVENLGAVGRCDEHEAGGGIEPVHLDEELIERLLLLVVPAGERAGAARAAQGIEFVDEDDRGRLGAGLLEEVADARGADADEHLDELGAGDREERHLRLARDRLREQRLPRAGRADEEDALRHPPAEPAVGFRVLEVVDDLAQLVLRLVDAGDVVEGDARIRLDVDLRLALPDRHQPAAQAPAAHPLADIEPDAEEQEDGQHPGEEVAEDRALDLALVDDVRFPEFLREVGVDPRGREPGLAGGERLAERALDEAVRHRDLGDLVGLEELLELAIGDRRDPLRADDDVLDEKEPDEGRDPVADVEPGLLVHRPGLQAGGRRGRIIGEMGPPSASGKLERRRIRATRLELKPISVEAMLP